MRQGKLEGRSGEWNIVPGAHRLKGERARQNVTGNGDVIVGCIGVRIDEQAAVVHASHNHLDPRFGTIVHEWRARLLKQRVAASQQEHFEVPGPGEFKRQLPLVHASSEGAHDTLVAKFRERTVCAVHQFAHAHADNVRVVDERNVEPSQAQAHQALLHRAQDAVVTVIVDDVAPAIRDERAWLAGVRSDVGAQKPPDFARHHGAVAAAKKRPEAVFRLPKAVPGSCVEVTQTGRPGGREHLVRLHLSYRLEQPALGGRAEPERGKGDMKVSGRWHGRPRGTLSSTFRGDKRRWRDCLEGVRHCSRAFVARGSARCRSRPGR